MGSRKTKTNSAEGNVVTNNSLLDVYAKRAMYVESIPDITNLNFLILPSNTKLLTTNLHLSHKILCVELSLFIQNYSDNDAIAQETTQELPTRQNKDVFIISSFWIICYN